MVKICFEDITDEDIRIEEASRDYNGSCSIAITEKIADIWDDFNE